MNDFPVQIPDSVRQRAIQLGEPGRRWWRQLPRVLARLSQEWSLTLHEVLEGGSGALVATVETADGTRAVLKVGFPESTGGTPTDPIGTLRRARGRGYVRLLAEDQDTGAVLLEALGPSLAALDWPVARQLDLLCQTLQEAWRVPRPVQWSVAPEQAKAQTLARFIEAAYERLHEPCSHRAVQQALRFAARRGSAFDLTQAVVVHGDPHPGNLLQTLTPRPGAESGFVFVDPEGFLEDPTYDLGVILRGWCDEMAPGDPLQVAQGICQHLARQSGFDAEAIWEWGFLERVSTGLYILDLGAEAGARPFLATADLLADTTA